MTAISPTGASGYCGIAGIGAGQAGERHSAAIAFLGPHPGGDQYTLGLVEHTAENIRAVWTEHHAATGFLLCVEPRGSGPYRWTGVYTA